MAGSFDPVDQWTPKYRPFGGKPVNRIFNEVRGAGIILGQVVEPLRNLLNQQDLPTVPRADVNAEVKSASTPLTHRRVWAAASSPRLGSAAGRRREGLETAGG
jgi:hypothetical protein